MWKIRAKGFLENLGKFWSSYKENKLGVLGLAILLFFLFISNFAEYIAPYPVKPVEGDMNAILKPPSYRYLLGTDELGRDLLSILIYGGRISLLIGFLATFITITIGTIVGVTAGYFGGKTEELLMRITDVFLVIPDLPLMIILSTIWGPSLWNMIVVIALFSWCGPARVLRAQVLSLKEKAFIESARAIGTSNIRIITRHILPNVIPLIIAQIVLRIGRSILSAASLSFLNLGDPRHISWGMTLHFAFSVGSLISNFYWYLIPPGFCITLVVLAFTFIGTALDKIVNPRLRRRE